ncbi:MAG: exopolyphosphatase [Flavisolibacter sp.]|nr:exopolyphosphatase [Flavisolibacter sp.]MBD0295285.1 exopolyphosphatase [Flavisolibacter sp.]MBD0352713.1 exopolyphosphatase [Flavisolibacter sp.]MBD0364966.1 exopolyphosphatase [Flavisolibacter sp.]
MRLAAIDIGSNAARLLIEDVIQNARAKPEFIKVALVRVPLRLGFDVFEKGRISKERITKIIKSLNAYKLLLEVYEVQHLKACATSAMRDAQNGKQIIKKVKDETGISIKIISGQEEASYIYENHIAENLKNDLSYLYINVGGGSTELAFFSDGKLIAKDSFNIGTIRLLKKQVTDAMWDKMKKFIISNTRGYHRVACIGSGGNINKVFSLTKQYEGEPLALDDLGELYNELKSHTLLQRMSKFKLREDRADVIVPALQIFINVMRWAESNDVYVPKIGLADGLIHILYDEVTAARIIH